MTSRKSAGSESGARSVDDRDALLREAALELRALRGELEARDAAERAPVAITGLACRLPGGIESPEAFWSALERGFDATSEVPPERWDVEAWYDPDPDVPGRMYTRRGAFVEDPAGFDPGFFGISPREARNLDPQQRLLLECAHEAFENAGIPIDSLRGSRTGVYVGLSLDDYANRTVRSGDPARIDAHSALGSQRAIAAGRIAYTFGLNGPALQIDTTCSSSLVAIHLALQALRRREVDRALVAGVNLVLTPESTVACCKLRALSPDGRCKTFSEDADGYGRGEGCAAFVLERAGEADPQDTLALIRGSGINHDGRSNGLTAPSRSAQTEVVRAALQDAGWSGRDLDYVEAHGTGTPLGDPIELDALHDALGPREAPRYVGSVKTNLGHLESAAGAAGLLKLVLALSAARIPSHLHCDRPSPRIDFDRLGFTVPTETLAWPEADRPRRAGISSFGMSGTNAHLVVESVDSEASRLVTGLSTEVRGDPREAAENETRPAVLALSAKSASHLNVLARAYARWGEGLRGDLAERCAFHNERRSQGPYRRAIAAADPQTLVHELEALATTDVGRVSSSPRVVFLFSGQGGLYPALGHELFEREPVFRETIERCASRLREAGGPDLLAVFSGETGAVSEAVLEQTGLAQPLIFSLQRALVALWRSWGIEPDAVLGHSVGEFAAACAAGALDWDEALLWVAERGRLMQALPGGAMLALSRPASEIEALLEGEPVDLAADNGAESVVAGLPDAIERIAARASERSIRATRLSVSHAFHGRMMAPMAGAFAEAGASIRFAPAATRWASTVTGSRVDGASLGATHWVRQLTEPVRFREALGALGVAEDAPSTRFVEIGPRSTLLGLSRAMLGSPFFGAPSLRPARRGAARVLAIDSALTSLYDAGVDVDWGGVAGAAGAVRSRLPNQPFLRERYWIDPASAEVTRPLTTSAWPGRRVPIAGDLVRCFSMEVDAGDRRVADHVVRGEVWWPATGFVELALAAARAAGYIRADATVCVSELTLRAPLVLPASCRREIQTQLQPEKEGGHRFEIWSRGDDEFVLHAHGRLERVASSITAGIDGPDADWHAVPSVSASEFYSKLADRGLAYGARFQGIDGIAIQDDEVLASLHADVGADPVQLLDLGLQAAGPLFETNLDPSREDETLVPIALRGLRIEGALDRARRIKASRSGDGSACVRWLGLEGQVVATLDRLILGCFSGPGAALAGDRLLPYFDVEYVEASGTAIEAPPSFPAASVLAKAIAPDFDRALGDPQVEAYQKGLAELDHVAAGHAKRALEDVDLKALGSSRTTSRFVARLQEMAASVSSGEAGSDGTALVNRYPALETEAEFVDRVGEALPRILRGEVDPLSVLFPKGDAGRLQALYGESVGARAMNAQVGRVIAHLSDAVAARPLRVLELGGGTGGTTEHVLSILDDRAEGSSYTFTDLSPQLVARARARFADRANMDFETLDLERPAVGHDRFDLILAANVVHATADVVGSLRQIETLLAPGGALVLLEGTRSQPWLDLVFGVTEGWWRFDDASRRTHAPLLSGADWDSVLAEAGFVDSAPMLPEEAAAPAQSVLVAFKSRVARPIRLVGEGDPVDRLEAKLREAGHPVSRSSLSVEDEDAHLVVVPPSGASLDASIREPVVSLFEETTRAARSTHLELSVVVIDPSKEDRLAASAIRGFLQALALERPTWRTRLIVADSSSEAVAELRSTNDEVEVNYAGGRRRVARLARVGSVHGAEAPRRLVHRAVGTLDQLAMEAGECVPSLGSDEVRVDVRAAGLNFRDVLIALDLYPEPGEMGCECVGVVAEIGSDVEGLSLGDPVMALGAGCFASEVVVRAGLAVRLPRGLDFVEAATLPVAFATAVAGLLDRAALGPGETVLIHNATGGVGQAAVQIARSRGARVFGSASASKRAALEALGVELALDSRDPGFAEAVLEATGGRGVDVVLSALPGEMRQRSIDVTVAGGRFVEIGKGEGPSPEEIAASRPDLSHFVLDLAALSSEAPSEVADVLKRVVSGVDQHDWRPLPTSRIEAAEAARAFRTMQRGQHVGKLVLDFSRDTGDAAAIHSVPFSLRDDAAYLVTGGLGGLGLAVARWLVDGGALHLVLLARNARPEGRQVEDLRALEALGASVTLVQADVTDEAGLAEALAPWTTQQSGVPLAGVIHAAGTLADGAIGRLELEDFERVLAPKVDGTVHLHNVTRDLPLEAFVLFSSASGLLGAPGQTNHAAANRFLDGFAEYRRALGLPALSIAWGPWSEIGAALAYAEEGVEDESEAVLGRREALGALPGIGMLAPKEALDHLGHVWNARRGTIGIIEADLDQVSRIPAVASLPYFEQVLSDADADAAQSGATPVGVEAARLLETLAELPPGERRERLDQHVIEHLARVLDLTPDAIDPRLGFFDLGVDSLTALELGNRIESDLGIALPETLLFDHPTPAALLDLLEARLFPDSAPTPDLAVRTPEGSTSGAGDPRGESTTAPDDDAIDRKLDELEALLALGNEEPA